MSHSVLNPFSLVDLIQNLTKRRKHCKSIVFAFSVTIECRVINFLRIDGLNISCYAFSDVKEEINTLIETVKLGNKTKAVSNEPVKTKVEIKELNNEAPKKVTEKIEEKSKGAMDNPNPNFANL